MEFKTLQQAMIAAMKAREKERKEAISVLVSAAKKLAIDEGCREDIPEELVDRAILKEIKSVKEQIDTCPADRTDLKEEGTRLTLGNSITLTPGTVTVSLKGNYLCVHALDEDFAKGVKENGFAPRLERWEEGDHG